METYFLAFTLRYAELSAISTPELAINQLLVFLAILWINKIPSPVHRTTLSSLLSVVLDYLGTSASSGTFLHSSFLIALSSMKFTRPASSEDVIKYCDEDIWQLALSSDRLDISTIGDCFSYGCHIAPDVLFSWSFSIHHCHPR